MIYFFVTDRYKGTIDRWRNFYADSLGNKLEVVSYERLYRRFDPGVFIFSDIERLPSKLPRSFIQIHNKATQCGFPVLNDPQYSMKRYDLQKTLSNNFDVFRTNESYKHIRFPVFLRNENDHRGNLTELIYDSDALEKALLKYPKALISEFIDTSDEKGIYRKYSVMRIGDAYIPDHILFSYNWMLKDSDLVENSFIEEETGFLETNPHQDAIKNIFNIANIQYGRIDYSLYNGKIQTWEINTNPNLRPPNLFKQKERGKVCEITAERINKAFDDILSLSSQKSSDQQIRFINPFYWFNNNPQFSFMHILKYK